MPRLPVGNRYDAKSRRPNYQMYSTLWTQRCKTHKALRHHDVQRVKGPLFGQSMMLRSLCFTSADLYLSTGSRKRMVRGFVRFKAEVSPILFLALSSGPIHLGPSVQLPAQDERLHFRRIPQLVIQSSGYHLYCNTWPLRRRESGTLQNRDRQSPAFIRVTRANGRLSNPQM